MIDINKMVQAENLPLCESEELLADLDPWSPEQAIATAHAEKLELNEAHLDVLCWLRDRYTECGRFPSARFLLNALEQEYAEQGGGRYLFRLFPGGPVTQGCRLAGIPVPPGSIDPSFGTTH